jgi:hypothetical protein
MYLLMTSKLDALILSWRHSRRRRTRRRRRRRRKKRSRTFHDKQRDHLLSYSIELYSGPPR